MCASNKLSLRKSKTKGPYAKPTIVQRAKCCLPTKHKLHTRAYLPHAPELGGWKGATNHVITPRANSRP